MSGRNDKHRRAVADLPCVCCGRQGHTQAAHANLQASGKGMGVKASDAALMALCARCHAELDQGMAMTKAERRQVQYEWMARTYQALMERRKIAV